MCQNRHTSHRSVNFYFTDVSEPSHISSANILYNLIIKKSSEINGIVVICRYKKYICYTIICNTIKILLTKIIDIIKGTRENQKPCPLKRKDRCIIYNRFIFVKFEMRFFKNYFCRNYFKNIQTKNG